MTDISAVLTLLPQAGDAHAALASLRLASTVALADGMVVEMVVVLARGAPAGRAALGELSGLRVIESGADNEAGLRNAAVASARGAHVAFLGDADMWGATWLLAACRAQRKDPRKTVWHPEATLHYGQGNPAWAIQPDIETMPGDWVTLAMRDHWTASCFAARDIYLDVPYVPGDWAWTWNAAVVAAGCVHRPVEGTAHLTSRPPPPQPLAPEAASLWRNRVGWGHRVGLLGRGAA